MHATIVQDVLAPRVEFRSTPISPESGPVSLGRQRHLRLTRPRGWSVRVCAGTVWLTQDGDPRDTILHVGQRFDVETNADVLVTAIDDARISLEPPPWRTQPVWRRTGTWLQALRGALRA